MPSAAMWNAPPPGRRMMRTPAKPSASCTRRGTVNLSRRNSHASSAVHIGMVNSIANTVASVSTPIE